VAVRDLIDILTWQRASGTASEATFVAQKIATLPGIKTDGYGNYHLQVGDEDPIVMWSCHTDTVTRFSGRQNVKWVEKGILGLNNPKPGQCLGADDGAGLWMMLEMIKAGKPGYYVFHRDEEVGGLGSSYLQQNPQYFPPTLKIAIAFDRAGTKDVITHQAFSRCCSTEFAESLAAQLGMGYVPDDTGVFTDTANYTTLIAECTNLSVGYEHQHGIRETLDVEHIQKLLKVILELDVSKLTIKRDPSVIDDNDMWSEYGGGYSKYSSGGYGHGGGGYRPYDCDVEDRWQDPADNYEAGGDDLPKTFGKRGPDYGDMVRNHPGIAARLLEELGVEAAEFRAHVFAFSGQLYDV
jgi:hypothetical protein